jgi:hypothetical protein
LSNLDVAHGTPTAATATDANDNSDEMQTSSNDDEADAIDGVSEDAAAAERAHDSEESLLSPFKKPESDKRQRHLSVASSSNASECSEDTHCGKPEPTDEQKKAFEQKLAYFRTPMVGKETVCIFCLTRCTERIPHLLTCLHSACQTCFKVRDLFESCVSSPGKREIFIPGAFTGR